MDLTCVFNQNFDGKEGCPSAPSAPSMSEAWVQSIGHAHAKARRLSSSSTPLCWTEAACSRQQRNVLHLSLGEGVIPRRREKDNEGEGRPRSERGGRCRTFCPGGNREEVGPGSWRCGMSCRSKLCGNVYGLAKHTRRRLARRCWRCGALSLFNLCVNVNITEANHHPVGTEDRRGGRCGSRFGLSLCGNAYLSISEGEETNGEKQERRCCGSCNWLTLCDNADGLAQDEEVVQVAKNGGREARTTRWEIIATTKVCHNVWRGPRKGDDEWREAEDWVSEGVGEQRCRREEREEDARKGKQRTAVAQDSAGAQTQQGTTQHCKSVEEQRRKGQNTVGRTDKTNKHGRASTDSPDMFVHDATAPE